MSRDRDLRTIRRGCTNQDVKDLIVAAVKSGARYRLTKSGIMLFGPRGSVSAHFTGSRAASRLLTVNMRQAGLLESTATNQKDTAS